MRTRSTGIAALTLLTTILAVVLTGITPAGAAPAGPFSAQAAAAGLAPSQADGLQRSVDRVLATEGGTQVDANTVLWKDGSGVTRVVVPGEREVRSFGPEGQDFHGCDYKWMCLYQYSSWAGTLHGLFYCQDYQTSYEFGSYANRQTAGTVGIFKDINRREWARTPGAYSESRFFDGSFTFWVRPC